MSQSTSESQVIKDSRALASGTIASLIDDPSYEVIDRVQFFSKRKGYNQIMQPKPLKDKRGGARPGSGPKRKLENVVRPKPYLNQGTVDFYIHLGNGNMSEGMRQAAKILTFIKAFHPQALIDFEKVRIATTATIPDHLTNHNPTGRR